MSNDPLEPDAPAPVATAPGNGERRDGDRRGGDLVELHCGAVAAGGAFVARADDGRVVFVRHALPGELVRARVTATTTSYLRADALEIVEPSPDRVAPPCRYAGPGRCGGCDFQHVAPAAQRLLKASLVSEQLRRLAGIECAVTVEEAPGAPGGLGWRTRVRFAVDRAGHAGFRRHRSHAVEVVERCLIASPAVEAMGAERARWRGAMAVEVFADELDDAGRARAAGARAAHGLVNVTPGPAGIRRRDLGRLALAHAGLVVGGETVRAPRRVYTEAAGHVFRVSAGSFWQVHRAAPALLAQAVVDGLAPRAGERVIDLFAGVGLFSAVLADAVGPTGSVLAVERDEGACADARHNLRGVAQARVVHAPVGPELLESLDQVDLVVLDPPREGAGIELMATLVRPGLGPRRIAYVACEPATFARDLKVALGAGWRLAGLRAFDLFPMTEHVELVGVLERPGDAP